MEQPAAKNIPLTPEQYAAKLLASMLTEHDEHSSLRSSAKAYKRNHEGTAGNARQTTGDFLINLMESIDGEVGVGSRIPSVFNFAKKSRFTTLVAAVSEDTVIAEAADDSNQAGANGLAFTYNFLVALRHLLITQSTKVSEAKLGRSAFAPMLLKSVGDVFKGHLGSLEAMKATLASQKAVGKLFQGKQRGKARKGMLVELLKPIEEILLPYFEIFQGKGSIQKAMLENKDADPIQALFDYCVLKEDNKRSHGRPAKRTKIYEVLVSYFMARTADDFVNVFKQIQEGIQASRKEGKDGLNSRGAEFGLIAFRDWLYHTLFVNEESKEIIQFTPEQLSKVLSYLRHFNLEVTHKNRPVVLDSEVCQYAIHLVDLIPGKSKEENTAEKIDLITKLIITMPDVINGQKITLAMKAEMLYKKGILWAETITELLQDPSLTVEQRQHVAVLGFMWNRYMAEHKVNDPRYYTPQIYVGFDVIRKHPLSQPLIEGTSVPKADLQAFQAELAVFCQSSIARVQSLVADRMLRQFQGAEESRANPKEKSVMGLVESHIEEKNYSAAIELLKKHLDIEWKLDKKIDRADCCVKAGSLERWAQAMTDLLQDVSLPAEQRAEVAICSFAWNKYMLNKDVRDPSCYVSQHYVSFDVLRKHPWLAKKGMGLFKKDTILDEIRKALEHAFGDNEKISHAQTVLASVDASRPVVKDVPLPSAGAEEYEELGGEEEEMDVDLLGVSLKARRSSGSGAMFVSPVAGDQSDVAQELPLRSPTLGRSSQESK